ncbi:PAS domain S-box protein [bacterium]|nr:PAS domain S-box protein [bacterium]
MGLKPVVLFLLLLLAPAAGRAVPLEQTAIPLSLGNHFQVLEDAEGRWSIGDVASPAFADRFTDNPTSILNLGFSDAVFWIRFRVQNRLAGNERLLLEAGFPDIEYLSLFIPQADGEYLEKKAGYKRPFEERDLKFHNFVFHIPPFEENTYYIRIKTRFAVQLFARLWTQDAFAENVAQEQLLLGLLYGIMLVMILYNLFIFVFTRDSSYLYYISFIVFVLFLLMLMNGMVDYFLPFPIASWLVHRLTIWVGVDILLGTLFMQHVLKTREHFPGFNRILVAQAIAGGLLAIHSIFNTGQVNVLLTFMLTLIASIAVFSLIGLGCIRRQRIAWISLIAFSPIIASNVIASLSYYGLMPLNLLSNHIVMLGTSLGAIVFSLLLADHINLIKREREQYASELKLKNRALLDEIGERKQVEKSLVESEKKYRGIFENALTPYLEISADGVLEEISPSFEKFSTYRKEELLGKPIRQLFVDGQQHDRFKDQILSTGEVDNIEIDVLDKDGSVLNILLSAKLLREEQKVIGSLLDITERKKAEREIHMLQSQLSNVFNAIPSIIISVDTQGRVINWNQQAEKLKNIPGEKARGRLISELLPEYAPYWEKIDSAMHRCQTEVEPRIHRIEIGREYIDSLTISPLMDDTVKGAVIRIDDITEQVRMNELMVQTEKMMSVGGLAAGMAHEINNPLGGILQGAQNILRRFSPDLKKNHETATETGVDLQNLQRYMEKRGIFSFLTGIQESGQKAAEIITNMLQFSRQDHSKMVTIDLARLMEKTLDLASTDYDLKKKFDFKNITIVREFDPDLPPVTCTETEIGQVILNLLKNAAQAMAGASLKDPQRIILRLSNEGDMARVEIEDTGPGMEEAVKKRIFEPFFTTKPVGEGTGLGLSVSYMIITNNHQGKFEVASEPGKGTRFIIRLPLKRAVTRRI